jgi:hypothetical protein
VIEAKGLSYEADSAFYHGEKTTYFLPVFHFIWAIAYVGAGAA